MRSAISKTAHYTPEHIVSLIVEGAIDRLCNDARARQLKRVSILDPACGDGAFLEGTHLYLMDNAVGIQWELCGVDTDSAALDRAWERLKRLPGDACRVTKLVHADSLKSSSSESNEPPGIDWRREFPEVMARGGFDAVIGNPPWASLSGRFGVCIYSERDIAELNQRFGGNTFMPNLFEYFVRLGLELTRPGGYFSFIVPDRLGFNQHLRELRHYLLKHGKLLLITYGIPFPGVTADTMVFLLQKGRPNEDSSILVSEHGGLFFQVPQAEVLASSGCEFPRFGREPFIRHGKRHDGFVKLGDVCEMASGFGGRSELIQRERTG